MNNGVGGQPQYFAGKSQTVPGSCGEDEINLIDLWQILVRSWRLILAFVGGFFIIAVVYLFIVKPVFEAEAIIVAPEQQYVELLTVPPDISKISRGDIFAQYQENLNRISLRKEFIRNNSNLEPILRQFEHMDFFDLLEFAPKIGKGKKSGDGTISVVLSSWDPVLGSAFVNQFIDFIDRKTINNYCDVAKARIEEVKQGLQEEIQKDLEVAALHRHDRIAMLDEQIKIARTLNIFERLSPATLRLGGQNVGVTYYTAEEPLYLRGVKELSGEKAVLAERKNEEPFIGDLREKQKSLVLLDIRLKDVDAARQAAHAMRVDQPAIPNNIPVKPKKLFVLALSILFGTIAGIFFAFLQHFIQAYTYQNCCEPDNNQP